MGVLSDPIDRLATMLADCVGFQKWLGVDSSAEALKRIYIDGFDAGRDADAMSRAELEQLRPYAIIYSAIHSGWKATKNASPNCWNWNGSGTVVLSRRYDESLSLTAHFRAAAALLEPILYSDVSGQPGITQMAGNAGYLAFSELSVEFAGRTPLEYQADYGDGFDCVLALEW
jgi:hypothetical protein